MSLSADFNDSGYKTSKINSYVLGVSYSYSEGSGYYNAYAYDFLARIVTARTGGSNDAGISVTPFSQLDPDSLETLRQRLIALGGKPPALTPLESPPVPKAGRSLNP